ncbi:hypothetical protein [Pararhodobacter sp. CCB-MM2]|uniref:hypothetical protein n=1 Tax=Pararhodobacter sp. CCB-MM2 TaxID=1786003 RepID=UPI001314F1AB|nr:hypothetical protein [Pararhodobacter sp. CCB-MM2]
MRIALSSFPGIVPTRTFSKKQLTPAHITRNCRHVRKFTAGRERCTASPVYSLISQIFSAPRDGALTFVSAV